MKQYWNPWLNNLVVFFSLFALCACAEDKDDNLAVARVGRVLLYESDLQEILGDRQGEDSLLFAQQYIDSWIRRTSLIEQAQRSLSTEQLAETDRQVNEYRSSLMSHMYENSKMTADLDSVVSREEIESYYLSNPDDFELAEPILKMMFVKTDSLIPQQDSIRQWLAEYPETGNDALLREYCSYHAIQCMLEDDTWIKESELIETMGLSSSKSLYKSSRGEISLIEDGKYRYLYRLIDVQLNGRAPVETVASAIEERILRSRQNVFLKEFKEAVYEAALERGDIEIYEK